MNDADLIRAIDSGDVAAVSERLQAGASPESRGGPDTVPALLLATRRGAAGIVQLLLACGADPNAAHDNGEADVNARSANGWSVMEHARWRKKTQRRVGSTLWVFGRVARDPDPVLDVLRAAGARD